MVAKSTSWISITKKHRFFDGIVWWDFAHQLVQAFATTVGPMPIFASEPTDRAP